MTKKTKKLSIEDLAAALQVLTEEVMSLKAARPQPIVLKREKGQPRPDVYYVLHGVPSQGLPPQAIACARVLSTARDVNNIPEPEAMVLLETAHQAGRIKTKQGAWHVFQYYRPRLIAGEFLQMKTVA